MSEKTKIDPRIIRTEEAIQEAFIKLLKKEEFEAITVSEIMDECNINRGTFYLHYKDKYDLLEKMQNNFLEKLVQQVETVVEDFHEPFSVEGENKMFRDSIFHYLTAVQKESELIMLFFNMDGEFDFLEKLNSIVIDNLLKNRYPFLKISNPQVPFHYLYSYMSGGAVKLLMSWIEGGMKETPEEMTDIILKLYTEGVQNLAHSKIN